MSEFKVGDKVRNKVTGDVASYVTTVESTLYVRVSFRHGENDSNTADWPPKDCEPYFENKPVSAEEQPPEESDYDSNGLLFVKRHGYNWRAEHINHFDNDDDPDVNLWMHTPDWTPRKPLLKSCKECEHCSYASSVRKKGSGEIEKEAYSIYCVKMKSHFCSFNDEEPMKPTYRGNTPCHLVVKDDA